LSDPDGSTLTYEWAFGDGATTTGETTSHSYADPGDYTVELTVTDEYGNTDTATSTITVTSRTPDASFTVDPSTGTADTSFSFDGSSSSDPDGSMLTYEWDFGDGATATGATTSHLYGTPDVYTVTLTVTDEYGASASTSKTVEVNDLPSASFTYSPSDPTTDDTIRSMALVVVTLMEQSVPTRGTSETEQLQQERPCLTSMLGNVHRGAHCH